MSKGTDSNDLQEIITQAIEKMKKEQGSGFDIQKINLAELERRTGITRAKLRKLQKDGFVVKPHALSGRKAEKTVLTGFTGVIDDLLRKGVSNAVVCYDRIVELGYIGSLTTVKVYIENHKHLIPPKRQVVSPQGNRGRRYTTGPGEAYQMDWGFVDVETDTGVTYRAACFAMICHHCGQRFIEFFPNAKQESLFIGMLHGFFFMGVPRYVLTDNMKSVVIRRDAEGRPLWQHDYESFMKLVGFETKLCKPRHPFTKGKVERLIRFVKENFLAGRTFSNVTELNIQALRWCNRQNTTYHRAVDCIPDEKHQKSCWHVATVLEQTKELAYYLCPQRLISFDGFVNFEGRRFGVPYWYTNRVCRVHREDFQITIYSDDLSRILTTHDVTWSRQDHFCRDQYVTAQPEEYPSMPVKAQIFQISTPVPDSGFARFNFGEGLWDE